MTAKRLINLLGSLLMVGGIALLVYVGVAYERSQNSSTSTTGWTASQQNAANRLAARLATHQRVAISHRLLAAVPRGGEVATRIAIPKIGVNAPVVETPPVGGVWDVADWSVGHLSTTANPGQIGNDALAAHDDIKGEIFKRLAELGPGDQVKLYTGHSVYTYVVTAQKTVDPSDVSVLSPTRNVTLTMISCAPYWVDTQRIVVQALLKTRSAA
ncbi:MAG TPA: sortase [Chloroflexota bacterium]